MLFRRPVWDDGQNTRSQPYPEVNNWLPEQHFNLSRYPIEIQPHIQRDVRITIIIISGDPASWALIGAIGAVGAGAVALVKCCSWSSLHRLGTHGKLIVNRVLRALLPNIFESEIKPRLQSRLTPLPRTMAYKHVLQKRIIQLWSYRFPRSSGPSQASRPYWESQYAKLLLLIGQIYGHRSGQIASKPACAGDVLCDSLYSSLKGKMGGIG